MIPKVIIVSISLVLLTTFSIVYADSLEVSTDKTSYKPYQIAIVTYKVNSHSDSICVKTDIVYPSGKINEVRACPTATCGEGTILKDGKCVIGEDNTSEILKTQILKNKLELDPFNFPDSGQYMIKAHYENMTSEATFTLTIPEIQPKVIPQNPTKLSQVYEGENPNEVSQAQKIVKLEQENADLKDQISQLSKRIDDLQAIVQEQIKVMLSMMANMTATQ